MLIDKVIEGFEKRGADIYSITQMGEGYTESRTINFSSACHNSYSVAKAFVVTAIGMLYDAGLLKTEEKVYDILREDFPEDHDPNWENVTLDNLMLHKIGLEKGFLDIDTEDVLSYGTLDYLRYAFSRKLPNEVGVERVYSDAAYYILSRVVAKKAGQTLTDFMLPRLFNPLKFREVSWSVCPYGHAIGATGLYIRSEDMAKLGWVYLNGGVYEGQRIVSEEWVNIVLDRGYELKPRAMRDMEGYCKGGMYGQMLYISKKENIVLAWHQLNKAGSAASKSVMDELGL